MEDKTSGNLKKIELAIDLRIRGLSVQEVRNKEVWASAGCYIYKSEDCGNTWKKIGKIPVSAQRSLLARFNLLRIPFRLGIRKLLVLQSNTILAVAEGRIYRSTDYGRTFQVVHIMNDMRKLLSQGIAEDSSGNIYYGEYWSNPKRVATHIYKSSDDGKTWQIVYTFSNGSIRHIHLVQFDPYTGWIWVATGDEIEESQIIYSRDQGLTWFHLGSNDLKWRPISLMFTKDFIYWGTDIPHGENYAYRWKRSNGNLERLARIDGPVWYSKVLGNSTLVMATTVEGRSWELDHCAHIWVSTDGEKWHDLKKWEKNWMPYRLFGYGIIFFARGKYPENYLFFTAKALKGVEGSLIRGKLICC